MKKIVKFGGSSLASAEQFKKVGDIIRADESRVYVVPSAPGKRFSDDTKVTDLLYKCYGAVADEVKFEDYLETIKGRYNEIIEGLGLDLSLDKEFEVIRKDFLAKAGREYAEGHQKWIVDKLMQLPDITFCPHGRPVAMELSKKNIDRQFERT